MANLLLFGQIVTAVLLMGAILIQSKGTGLGRSFGAGQSSFTRRGLEKVIFRATFVLTALFVIISIIPFLV
jgi:protein translocase SecG subunit